MTIFLFFYIPLCIAVAILASRYRRSGFGWFLFSLLLSPVLGFVFVLACGPKPPQAALAPSVPIPLAHQAQQPAGAPVGHGGAEAGGNSFAGAVVVMIMVAIVVVVGIVSGNTRERAPTAPVVAAWKAEAKPTAASVQAVTVTSCSKLPAPLPTPPAAKTLKQCQDDARAMLKAMLANLRVVVACREEFVARTGPHTQAAQQVRASNTGITRMIPTLERDSETQIRKANTLAKCQDHISDARKLVSLQPEFRGKWD